MSKQKWRFVFAIKSFAISAFLILLLNVSKSWHTLKISICLFTDPSVKSFRNRGSFGRYIDARLPWNQASWQLQWSRISYRNEILQKWPDISPQTLGPRLHYSAPHHFLNDPNGIFLDSNGTCHLYYQCLATNSFTQSNFWLTVRKTILSKT